MTPLHATICRTCSVVPVVASAGVLVAGLGDTGPLWAAATDGIRPAALAVRAHKAATGVLHSNQRLTACIMPPFAPHDRRGHQSPRCRAVVVLCSYVSRAQHSRACLAGALTNYAIWRDSQDCSGPAAKITVRHDRRGPVAGNRFSTHHARGPPPARSSTG